MTKWLPKYWYLLALPVLWLYLGIGMNQLVMLANGNQMPVYFPASTWDTVCADPSYLVQRGDLVHVCMNKHSHLKFLADWIELGNPVPEYIMSPGDLLIFLSEGLQVPFFVAWLALACREFKEEREQPRYMSKFAS